MSESRKKRALRRLVIEVSISTENDRGVVVSDLVQEGVVLGSSGDMVRAWWLWPWVV